MIEFGHLGERRHRDARPILREQTRQPREVFLQRGLISPTVAGQVVTGVTVFIDHQHRQFLFADGLTPPACKADYIVQPPVGVADDRAKLPVGDLGRPSIITPIHQDRRRETSFVRNRRTVRMVVRFRQEKSFALVPESAPDPQGAGELFARSDGHAAFRDLDNSGQKLDLHGLPPRIEIAGTRQRAGHLPLPDIEASGASQRCFTSAPR